MISINTVPRTIIKAGLQGLRLPLTAVERVTRNDGAAAWPPAVAYESFEAQAKKVLGSLIGDDELVREGTLQRAKVEELGEAERLEAKAERKRQEADARLEARQESAEQARARAEHEAAQREQELNREKAEKQRSIAAETRAREQAAARVAEVRDKAVTARERDAARTRIVEESAALAERSEALAATKKAQTIDTALETKKAQRKTG